MTLEFLILGPFEIHLDGEPLALGGRQQRALLAALTLRANELVSSERLIDELWPEDPPDTADHLVHVYVSRLRKALGDEGRPILVTRPPGYQLVLERGQVDLDRFEDHVAAARSATEEGHFAEASARLREALALWRGPALADVASESFARADAERLNELRVAATEDLMGSELAVGRDDLVPELKSLVAQHPLRERLRGFLMVALYREGRQAEALDAYERTRAILAEELGIDPSHELQELHRRVLAQDPTLRAATPTLARSGDRDDLAHTDAPVTPTAPARRRLGLVLAGLIMALVLVAIGFVTLNHPPATPTSAAGRSAVALLGDATDAPASPIVVDGSASAIAADGTELWVADGDAGTVTRIHTDTRTSELPVSSVIDPIAITAGDGRAWVLDPYAGRITSLDASGQIDTGFRLATRRLRSTPCSPTAPSGWSTPRASASTKQTARPASAQRTITSPFAGAGPVRIDAGPGAIWVLNGIGRSLVRISPWNGAAGRRSDQSGVSAGGPRGIEGHDMGEHGGQATSWRSSACPGSRRATSGFRVARRPSWPTRAGHGSSRRAAARSSDSSGRSARGCGSPRRPLRSRSATVARGSP